MKNTLVGLVVLLGLCCGLSLAHSQAPEPGQTAQGATPAETGGKRAREFQGDDLAQVLRLLARQAKVSMVVGEAVKGNITMRLEDVTAMDAVEVLVRQSHLTMTKDDKGVIYINAPETSDAALDLLAKPQTADRAAKFIHNLYDSLIKEGFTRPEAVEIIKSIGPSLVYANSEKKPDAVPPK